MAKVLVTSRTFGRVVHSGVELLKEHGFNICYIDPKERPLSEEKMARIVAEQNPIAIICGTEPITPRVLGASKDLRIVMKRGVGLDNIDLSAATELGIAVGYVPEANKEAVADLTVALILMLVRDLWRAIKTTKSGLWLPFIGHELRAITVGVVGTGNIGTAVIQRLHGFRPRLLAYDLNPKSELMENYGVQYTSLEALLRESDVVTLHVPLTAQTKGMIGRRELDLMKRTAFLVNTARGEIVDEIALYEYLKERRVAGAALDVFSEEPPKYTALLQLENVIATPHIGAYTYEAMETMDLVCAETIIDFFKKQQLKPNIINAYLIYKRNSLA